MSRKITIGARSSTLAKLQAYTVGKKLKDTNPDLTIVYKFKEASGDKDLTSPLWQIAGKGIFTKDLQDDLLKNEVDAIVHSWKDLDLEKRQGTSVISVLPREDQRDVLLFKKSAWQNPDQNLTFCTSSPRREFNLQKFFSEYLPDPLAKSNLSFSPIRGNVQTRIKKFLESDAHGLIIAKAALDRLLNSDFLSEDISEFAEIRNFLRHSLNQCLLMILPLSLNPNAPAQGALCVEVREDEKETQDLFSKLTDPKAKQSSETEREILSRFGGGCHQKIGVSVIIRPYGQVRFLQGETDEKENLSKKGIEPKPDLHFSIDEVWPSQAKMAQRQRERIAYKIPPNSDLFIARGYAFPQDLIIDPKTQIVWTSGLTTWRELAKRGVWVHGSVDGLGELEDLKIETLFHRKPNFVKLSHQDSDLSKTTYQLIPTYHLSAPEIPANFDPEKIKAAFWRSGSEFNIITSKYPILKKVIHFVGPGSTFSKVKSELGEEAANRIHVCLSFEGWIENHITK
ncbi:hydroxymethylbilane synthase [Leptospira kobayashii]|uniref:hydroxymethylbilane synthase n=1 Tax=Leptospira kobayashii TaxID=1917830 RepID=UPI000D59B0C1|nr:hydroxymethylbilane synthase [Leptospira kobayashii]